jgi:hypothetical protein
MAAEIGFQKPTNRVVANPGAIAFVREKEVETATGMYAGRLVKAGSTDAEVVVNDTSDNSAVIGWLGYEQASMDDRPDTIDTIWTINKSAPILNGPGMFVRAALCGGAGNSVVVGTPLRAASYYGTLDKFQSPSVKTSSTISDHNKVAISLETLDKSAVARTSTSALWVVSLI